MRLIRSCLLFIMFAFPATSVAQFVIVVSQNSPIDSLSHEQLYKLFRGQTISAKFPQPVQVVEFGPESDDFYENLYGMNAFAVGKHWLRKIFAGDKVLPPKNFSDHDKFIEFLQKNRRAIGFLSKATFRKIGRGTLKSIVINRKRYNQSGYSLKGK